jgi:hypothetical protein
MLARKALYHLSITPALFALLVLEIGLGFCPGQPGPQSLYFKLPTVTGMTGPCYHTYFFSVEMGSHKVFFFLPRLAWKFNAPHLSLLHSLG